MRSALWKYLEYQEPFSGWPKALPKSTQQLHQGSSWVYWEDQSVTSLTGVEAAPVTSLTQDAVYLIDLVWHSCSYRNYKDWGRLASVERIVEREVLGLARPFLWRGKLERLQVEYSNGDQGSLFVHSFYREVAPVGFYQEVSPTFPEDTAGSLEKVEPLVLYEVGLDTCIAPVDWPKGAPTAVLARPNSGCFTVYEVEAHRDIGSLAEVFDLYQLRPEWLRLVSSFIYGITPSQLVQIELSRNNPQKLSYTETEEGVFLHKGEESRGPCSSYEEVLRSLHSLSRSGPWHIQERRARFAK